MEAGRDFIPFGQDVQGTGRDCGQGVGGGAPADAAGLSGVGPSAVRDVLSAVRQLCSTAVEDAALWDLGAASDFAGGVEEISRAVEYLQLVAASAVDRAGKQPVAEAAQGTSWTTGWRDEDAGCADPGCADPGIAGPGSAGPGSAEPGFGGPLAAGPAGCSAAVAAGKPTAGDGYRNTVEFLRARLRIGTAEARGRLALAAGVLPRQGLAGRSEPAVHQELGEAVAAGAVGSRAAAIIVAALSRVRHVADPEAVARMEQALTRTAAESDTDFLSRVARGWADAVDQDGAEPSEELLRQRQGAFIRRQRHGLHHLEVFATAEQFEQLVTVMNTATNPRTGSGTADPGAAHDAGLGSAATAAGGAATTATDGSAAGQAWAPVATGGVGWTATAGPGGAGWVPGPAEGAGRGIGPAVSACGSRAAKVSANASGAASVPESGSGPGRAGGPGTVDGPGTLSGPVPASGLGDQRAEVEDAGVRGLDLRTRAQKQLDGLVGACQSSLATGTLPAAGGLRPQVMVTIDYRDLLARLGTTTGTPADATAPTDTADTAGMADPVFAAGAGTVHAASPGQRTGRLPQTGWLLFTGPVTVSTVRKIACDADIIPVLLGTEGRVLDIGRASRIFPPHIRKALIARDQGCTFPGCTTPAAWCEAHHIDYWSRGGSTGTENGTLLCSHHHHLIHKEQWTIQVRTGIAWFIPPPHIDPRQHPRRNHYFHPARLIPAA